MVRRLGVLAEVTATERPPGSHGEFYRPISWLPCPSYKTMNQGLVIGPFLHIRCPEGHSQVWWSAFGRLLVSCLVALKIAR